MNNDDLLDTMGGGDRNQFRSYQLSPLSGAPPNYMNKRVFTNRNSPRARVP